MKRNTQVSLWHVCLVLCTLVLLIGCPPANKIPDKGGAQTSDNAVVSSETIKIPDGSGGQTSGNTVVGSEDLKGVLEVTGSTIPAGKIYFAFDGNKVYAAMKAAGTFYKLPSAYQALQPKYNGKKLTIGGVEVTVMKSGDTFKISADSNSAAVLYTLKKSDVSIDTIKNAKTGEVPNTGTYDLKGATVKIRLWDFLNPYDETTSEADKAKYLPVFEAAKKKYNCNFEFFTSEVEYNDMPAEFIRSVANGKPVWHITNNISSMWLMELAANKALADISQALKTVSIPESYKVPGKVKNGIYGFVTGVATEGLIFNRKMIADAKMQYTPSEMFKMGKWSYDDFYAYLTELQKKLPQNTYAFFIDPNYWHIFAAPANGSMAIDNNFKFTATDTGFVESIEFLQKLMKAGVIRPANTNAEGKPDFWNTPAETFDKGLEVAMTHRATWQFGRLKGNGVDWGYVPYPWGSNVKLTKAGDYTSLSPEYKAAYYDAALTGCILAGSEESFPGVNPEEVYAALLHLTLDLFVDPARIAELEKMAKGGEVEAELELGDFNDMLSAQLYNWELKRTVLNPIVVLSARKLGYSNGGTVSFSTLIRTIIAEDKPVRATLEAVKAEIEAGLREAGY